MANAPEDEKGTVPVRDETADSRCLLPQETGRIDAGLNGKTKIFRKTENPIP